MRNETLTWDDVDKLIDHLIPQFDQEYDALLMITHGGIVPGGILAEAMGINDLFVAAVDFPAEVAADKQRESGNKLAWPQFLMFPEAGLLRGRRILVVDDVWGSGRTMTAVRSRIQGLAGSAHTCVLHFHPYRNLFGSLRPDYYAAITDAHIVYPWELRRGQEGVILGGLPG